MFTMVHVLSLSSLILSFFTAVAGILYYNNSLSRSTSCRDSVFSSAFGASWRAWIQSPCIEQHDDWNLHQHLGGYGPWVEKSAGDDDDELQGVDVPGSCTVDQIHMVLDLSVHPRCHFTDRRLLDVAPCGEISDQVCRKP